MDKPKEPSIIAAEIKKLKERSGLFLDGRERVPQPTFWLSFNERLKKIKRLKDGQRAIAEILSGE